MSNACLSIQSIVFMSVNKTLSKTIITIDNLSTNLLYLVWSWYENMFSL